ncbi:MAG: hypothetical protein R3C70_10905 [Geminicoccaceae bacterium]
MSEPSLPGHFPLREFIIVNMIRRMNKGISRDQALSAIGDDLREDLANGTLKLWRITLDGFEQCAMDDLKGVQNLDGFYIEDRNNPDLAESARHALGPVIAQRPGQRVQVTDHDPKLLLPYLEAEGMFDGIEGELTRKVAEHVAKNGWQEVRMLAFGQTAARIRQHYEQKGEAIEDAWQSVQREIANGGLNPLGEVPPGNENPADWLREAADGERELSSREKTLIRNIVRFTEQDVDQCYPVESDSDGVTGSPKVSLASAQNNAEQWIKEAARRGGYNGKTAYREAALKEVPDLSARAFDRAWGNVTSLPEFEHLTKPGTKSGTGP